MRLQTPNAPKNNLCSLLGYAEEIMKAAEPTVSDLTKHADAHFHEADVATLKGVVVPTDEDGCWLRVERLRENPAPAPDPSYVTWGLSASTGPSERPRLAATNLVHVSLEDASDLLEAGLASADDVMNPKGERVQSGGVDILMRLDSLKEFTTAFEAWLDGPWVAWEIAERPRRRSVAFYNRLFEIQQRASSMGEDASVEAIFGVGMARYEKPPAARINIPLVEAPVELELDPDDGAIIVRARPQPPRLALRAFDDLEIPGVGRLQKEASQQLQRLHDDPDTGFSPHDRASFEPILRMCHARLAADAVYEPDGREPGDRTAGMFDSKLRITDSWVLYVRPRSSNFRCDDIRRLIIGIEAIDEADLPPAGLQLTMQPNDTSIDDDIIDLNSSRVSAANRLASAPSSPRDAQASAETEQEMFFFPLPYNDEQLEIARRLEHSDTAGVVVQGPPGTGKTHTIANIIAHYMATGRRVLVSAHQPEALAAIRGKLPESIRDLAIAVIHSDREGARRLEAAVSILASHVKQIDKRVYNERRMQLEDDLAATRAGLAEVDLKLRELARMNLAPVEFQGQRMAPMELAGKVEAERPQHIWFEDMLDLSARFDPLFGDQEIAEIGRLRAELGRDLAYVGSELPEPTWLPDVPRLLAAHDALAKEKETATLLASGELPYVSFSASAGLDEARALHAWLEDAAKWLEEISTQHTWLVGAYRLLAAPGVEQAHTRSSLLGLFTDWATIAEEGQVLALSGIEIGDPTPLDEAFDAAVEAHCAGRKPFSAFSFGKSKTKAQLDAVRVAGASPKDAAGWTLVRRYRTWHRQTHAFLGRWPAAAAAVGYPTTFGEWPAAYHEVIRIGAFVRRMNRLHAEADRHSRLVSLLFPYGVDPQHVIVHLKLSPAREALASSLRTEGHSEARALRQRLLDLGASCPRPFHAALRQLVECLGDRAVPARQLAEGWRQLLDEATRLDRLKPKLARLRELAALVGMSGATVWGSKLAGEPWADENDPWTPAIWLRSWKWARADGHVRTLSNPRTQADLASSRLALDKRCSELLGELVMVRTYIGLKQGITERVASALQKFATKVRQLGGGTGKSAERHRRAIREATLEAAVAVPCWILPEWRVAEQLPSELGTFDLVIVDEASQSDITSLPAVLRGKKVLIVGDDKQVSPIAVGMEERTVIQLRETFLRGMGMANFLEPTTSLYDLASMTFPGSVIMLREHFRCVEPIIAFSSRFYPKALIPLRVPTSEERLDPPLVDVYIPDGHKVRDVNPAEADFIVSEIASLVVLPEYSGRTFGVVSLIGEKQAKLIQDRLVDVIGTDVIARHRIMCGNASTFQGQERDVMFLSMVACPATARAQTARLMEQRFNVAMSRARDRMYLVRSVAASMLSPADLKAAVIEHFRNPVSPAAEADRSVLDETESPFEREVGELLLARGYRIRPQVQVGAFRIDIVVEGEGSRRLAVELDGDRYHGPERWFEDMHRQRALERLGWTFWRCWGSHWLSDRQECMDDLLAALGRLGIEPMEGEASAHRWTEHRVIGPQQEQLLADALQVNDVAVSPITEDEATPIVASGPKQVSLPATPSPRHQPELELGLVTLPRQPELDLVAPIPVSDMPTGAEFRPADPSATVSTTVEVGDTVIVRFADDNHVRRFKLTAANNDPERGEVSAGQPIAKALLGNELEEEVELVIGGKKRLVIIEKITKAA